MKCPFCSPSRSPVLSSKHSFAFYDAYPVSEGHLLVVPKEHVPAYFQLSEQQESDLWKLVQRAKEHLEKKYHPDGFNVGFNEGAAAGQTIHHVHIHIIPRYQGDVEDPTGGIRNVIPGKGNYRMQMKGSKT
jgi:diadenosine tetraphosphate (Ap4A) HIT family hydrolase